jgi:hypothetical protein
VVLSQPGTELEGAAISRSSTGRRAVRVDRGRRAGR